MDHHAELKSELIELAYDLLPEDRAAELRARIAEEPETAALYEQVKQKASIIAEASRFVTGQSLFAATGSQKLPDLMAETMPGQPDQNTAASESQTPAALEKATEISLPEMAESGTTQVAHAEHNRPQVFRLMPWEFAKRAFQQERSINRIMSYATLCLVALTICGFAYQRYRMSQVSAMPLRVVAVVPDRVVKDASQSMQVQVTDLLGKRQQVPVRVTLNDQQGTELAELVAQTDAEGQLTVPLAELAKQVEAENNATMQLTVSAGQKPREKYVATLEIFEPQQVQPVDFGTELAAVNRKIINNDQNSGEASVFVNAGRYSVSNTVAENMALRAVPRQESHDALSQETLSQPEPRTMSPNQKDDTLAYRNRSNQLASNSQLYFPESNMAQNYMTQNRGMSKFSVPTPGALAEDSVGFAEYSDIVVSEDSYDAVADDSTAQPDDGLLATMSGMSIPNETMSHETQRETLPRAVAAKPEIQAAPTISSVTPFFDNESAIQGQPENSMANVESRRAVEHGDLDREMTLADDRIARRQAGRRGGIDGGTMSGGMGSGMSMSGSSGGGMGGMGRGYDDAFDIHQMPASDSSSASSTAGAEDMRASAMFKQESFESETTPLMSNMLSPARPSMGGGAGSSSTHNTPMIANLSIQQPFSRSGGNHFESGLYVQSDMKVTGDAQPEVSIVPEGGQLVAGLENRVFFRANVADRPVDQLSGYVTDDEGKKVAKLECAVEGYGQFYLAPEQGRQYKVVVDQWDSGSQYAGGGRQSDVSGVISHDVLKNTPETVPLEVPITLPEQQSSFGVGVARHVIAPDEPVTVHLRSREAGVPVVLNVSQNDVSLISGTTITEAGVKSVRLPLPESVVGLIEVAAFDAREEFRKPVGTERVLRRPTDWLSVHAEATATVQTEIPQAEQTRYEVQLHVTDAKGHAVPDADVTVRIVQGMLPDASTDPYFADVPSETGLRYLPHDGDFVDRFNHWETLDQLLTSDDTEAVRKLEFLVATGGLTVNETNGGKTYSVPVMIDNLPLLQTDYQQKITAFQQSRRTWGLVVGIIVIFGGMALAVLSMILVAMRLASGSRMFVVATVAGLSCVFVCMAMLRGQNDGEIVAMSNQPTYVSSEMQAVDVPRGDTERNKARSLKSEISKKTSTAEQHALADASKEMTFDESHLMERKKDRNVTAPKTFQPSNSTNFFPLQMVYENNDLQTDAEGNVCFDALISAAPNASPALYLFVDLRSKDGTLGVYRVYLNKMLNQEK